MNRKIILAAASISSLLLLSACGTNDNNVNEKNVTDTSMQNRYGNELRRVNYPDYTPGYNVANYAASDSIFLGNANRYDNNIINENVNYTNRNNKDNNNRLTVADKAADKIAALREVDQANVLVTDENAYVAAKLAGNAGDKLGKNVEKKISELVKSTDRDIDNVYVSVNPDFYRRTTTYANDIRNGHPVAGFFDEFSTLVRRIFPTQR